MQGREWAIVKQLLTLSNSRWDPLGDHGKWDDLSHAHARSHVPSARALQRLDERSKHDLTRDTSQRRSQTFASTVNKRPICKRIRALKLKNIHDGRARFLCSHSTSTTCWWNFRPSGKSTCGRSAKSARLKQATHSREGRHPDPHKRKLKPLVGACGAHTKGCWIW